MYFIIVGSIKHWKSPCGKMQTRICRFYHVNIRLKCHKFNFKMNGIFELSSYGNFTAAFACF